MTNTGRWSATTRMHEQRWGRIVNISSIFGKRPGKEMLDGNATKVMISLTKPLADEIAKDNVLVNVVCPRPARTASWEDAAKIISREDPGWHDQGGCPDEYSAGAFWSPRRDCQPSDLSGPGASKFYYGYGR